MDYLDDLLSLLATMQQLAEELNQYVDDDAEHRDDRLDYLRELRFLAGDLKAAVERAEREESRA